jgi:hypothetical protein
MLKNKTSLNFDNKLFHQIKSSRTQTRIFFFMRFETLSEYETRKFQKCRKKTRLIRTIWVQKNKKLINDCMILRLMNSRNNVLFISSRILFNFSMNDLIIDSLVSISMLKTVTINSSTFLKSFRDMLKKSVIWLYLSISRLIDDLEKKITMKLFRKCRSCQ